MPCDVKFHYNWRKLQLTLKLESKKTASKLDIPRCFIYAENNWFYKNSDKNNFFQSKNWYLLLIGWHKPSDGFITEFKNKIIDINCQFSHKWIPERAVNDYWTWLLLPGCLSSMSRVESRELICNSASREYDLF